MIPLEKEVIPMDQTILVIDVLKKLLKSRGIVYQDLARELKLSLPSVKRLFSKGDLTLTRLNDICRVIDIPMSEVFKLIDSEVSSEPQVLSDEQERFLARNPDRLAYLELLLNEMTPKQIEREFGLKEQTTVKILAELDKWGLIEWNPKNRVKIKGAKMIKLQPNGPLRKLIKDKGIKAFLDDEFSQDSELQDFVTFKATEETLKKFNKELKALINKTLKDGLIEEKTALNTISLGAFVAVRPWRLVDAFLLRD
jgi:transcriptional regulator with XRE-family HTH domain